MLHRTMHRPPGHLLILLLLISAPLTAGTIYQDRPAWEAETLSISTIDFEGLTSTWSSYNTAAGLTVGDVQFAGLAGGGYSLTVVNSAYDPSHDFGSGSVLKGPYYWGTDLSRQIEITLPSAATVFGLDFMSIGSSPEDFAITLSNGEAWTGLPGVAAPGRQFFGVVSETPFTQVQLMLSTGINSVTYPVIDNVAWGAAGAPPPGETPEAGTLLLVGGGLIMLWRIRRRQALPAAASA